MTKFKILGWPNPLIKQVPKIKYYNLLPSIALKSCMNFFLPWNTRECSSTWITSKPYWCLCYDGNWSPYFYCTRYMWGDQWFVNNHLHFVLFIIQSDRIIYKPFSFFKKIKQKNKNKPLVLYWLLLCSLYVPIDLMYGQNRWNILQIQRGK